MGSAGRERHQSLKLETDFIAPAQHCGRSIGRTEAPSARVKTQESTVCLAQYIFFHPFCGGWHSPDPASVFVRGSGARGALFHPRAASVAMGFTIPQIAETDSWGPSADAVDPDKALTYAPFTRSDKFGRGACPPPRTNPTQRARMRNPRRPRRDRAIASADAPFAPASPAPRPAIVAAADWNQTGYGKYGGNRYSTSQSGVSTVFNFFAEDDDAEFSLVDNKPPPRTRFGGRRFNQNRGPFMRRDQTAFVGGDVGQGASRERARQQRMQSKKSQQWNTWSYNRNRDVVTYASSVEIRPEWSVLEQITLTELTKQRFDITPDFAAEDLGKFGALRRFDKAYDRVTPKLERDLVKAKRRGAYHVSTSDDPTLEDLAKKNAGTVFATDAMVAAIMCAARSVYGWDLVVTKRDGKVFFDKRDEGNFDLLTVSETAHDAITDDKEDINGVHKLSRESTEANANFIQQCLSDADPAEPFGSEDPIGDEDSPTGHAYRKWTLGSGVELVARCELNGVQDAKGGADQKLLIRALTEFDSKVTGMDWRAKIETQRGAVIATELKNNANKLAKWTACALLADADVLKLGFVSRAHPRDPANHTIVNTQSYKPRDFAQQINLTESNMWGVFKTVAEACLKLQDGKYLLVKDPNKPILRTYEVPEDAFDDGYAKEPIQ